MLSAAQVRERFPGLQPPDGFTAVWEPRAGILFPEACISAHLDQAARAGAILQTNEPVLDWAADGRTIVYCGLAGERLQIFAIPRSGGPPRLLTNDPANLMHPQVSPDGRWIACTRMSQSKEIRRLKL
jgi:glycine/D-amino acid oxidase-like deaminating enzyme